MKIQKGQSESVNRRTENSMAKRKKNKRTNNDLQNTTQKSKYRATRTSLKTGVNSGDPEGYSSCLPTCTSRVTLVSNLVASQERGN